MVKNPTLSGSSAIGLPGKAGGNATAQGTVRVDTVGQHLTVRPVHGECLSLTVPAQDFTPRLRLAEPAAAQLCPDAEGRPLLETDLDSDRPPLVRASVPALALDLSIGAGAGATRLLATTPVLAIAPATQPEGSYRLTAADGKLALPGLSVEDVDAEAMVVPGARGPDRCQPDRRAAGDRGRPGGADEGGAAQPARRRHRHPVAGGRADRPGGPGPRRRHRQA